MANIKVAVRVRPISAREVNLTGSEVVVRTDPKEISLTNLKVSSSKAGDSRERTRRYGFDYCFDSSNPEAESYADQARIYETLGQSVLAAVFSGFNSCLVAYGQTASGKTYTMMGTKDDPGLTPRLCEGLFERIKDEEGNERAHRVSVSYLEIYNERVRDLLRPSSSTSGLRVREHPRLGPYVQGLTHHVVRSLGSLMSYVEEGTRARKTASTLQNPSSSRSHALLTITVTPTDATAACPGASVPASVPESVPESVPAPGAGRRNGSLQRGCSRLHLVDLAGSESAATCSGVHRLKEGANINKSLVALGNVISALAERGSTGSGPGRRFIPYRDSSLTWLLKDALGGNATTIMLATISPASGSYNETSHTLRFAQRAQSVVNRPMVNEDPVARIIRELRAEVSRLKSLLLEKDAQPDAISPCSCKNADRPTEPETRERGSLGPSERGSLEDGCSRRKDAVPVRRFNSSESVAVHESLGSVRRCGSCELVSSKDRFPGTYSRARVAELKDEEDEINESVFVDIPTLVAVLIKPDESLQSRSAQLEEICSDEVPEDSMDAEFMEGGNDRESIDHDDRSSSVNSCHASLDNEVAEAEASVLGCEKKGKFCKQDSMDVISASNLQISKTFGSVEAIQRKKESVFALERSHTNLEKRPAAAERAKKLNNIREIEDHKTANRGANVWRGAANGVGTKEQLQRKGSNDSDKSAKDCGTPKSKVYARKPSVENLKRKTSKDSSSSSSKEEQILVSSLAREKSLRRKNSLEQEPPSGRAHTPIQRVKRAEIVAAVTERLYSSRKHAEEEAPSLTAAGIRSPPEGTDVRTASSSVFAAKSKLQELSRKMLAKRRRVTTDTQTDFPRTVRMKDSASLTEEAKVVRQDVGVLTDDHENCENAADRGIPVVRVKEISTLTDKPRTSIVRCKDVGSLANDLEYYDYGTVHSPRIDSGILSDDTQNYAESNLSSTEASDLCPESFRRVVCTESSTNTVSSCRASAVQTPRQDVVGQGASEIKTPSCGRRCRSSVEETRQRLPAENPEKNVISISVPDTISITIESTNVLESRIAVMDGLDPTEERVKISTRNGEAQTDERDDFNNETESRFSFKDFTRSTLSQTDGRVFRIENIFQDPNNLSRTSAKTAADSPDKSRIKNSVTFTNSLGTSYIPDLEPGKPRDDNLPYQFQRRSFVKDGLITEAFIAKKRNCSLCPINGSHSIARNDPWRSWTIYCPTSAIRSVDYKRATEVSPSICQSRANELLSSHSNTACQNCSGISLQTDSRYETVNEKTDSNPPSSSNAFDSSTALDHDHNFSDDSLDYNESNVTNGPAVTTAKTEDELETRENLCPPDVVAHTKKESQKSVSNAELENGEVPAVGGEFENGRVELPKAKPGEPSEALRIHDYESLILGKPRKLDEESDSTRSSERLSSPTKKRVSFCSSSIPEEPAERVGLAARQSCNPSLRSIIKKIRRENETEDSQTEDRSSLTSENDCRDDDWTGEARLTESDELSAAKTDRGFHECRRKSSTPRLKRVKFSAPNHAENSCSESDSCENADEDDPREDSARNILEEYLDEAVTFMRNMNSINEYMSATKMFERYLGQERRRGEGHRRKNCASWNQDYVEFMGRRVSLKDDTDKYLREDEDIVVPTESYDRCIKGIQRLESCIEKVDRQNELLREKYGINSESAGARLSLASPSTALDTVSTRGNDSGIIDDLRTSYLHERRTFLNSRSSAHYERKQNDFRERSSGTKDDDSEKRIFDELMSAADSRHRRLRQGRCSRASDLRPRSPTSYSKFSELRNFAETPRGNDGTTDYEAIAKSSNVRARFAAKAIDSEEPNEDLRCASPKLTRGSIYSDKSSQPAAGFPLRSGRGTHEDDLLERPNLKSSVSFPMYRTSLRNSWERISESEEKVRAFSKSETSDGRSPIEQTTDSMNGHPKDKLKYPGSPRARFLELLRERRRIVESSRGTSAS